MAVVYCPQIPIYYVDEEKIMKRLNVNFKNKNIIILVLDDSSFVGSDMFNNVYIGKFYGNNNLSMFIVKKKSYNTVKVLTFNGKLNDYKISGYFEKLSIDEVYKFSKELSKVNSSCVNDLNSNRNDDNDIDYFNKAYYECCKAYKKETLECEEILKNITTNYHERFDSIKIPTRTRTKADEGTEIVYY